MVLLKKANGDDLGDFDIPGDRFVVEVTEGNGAGKLDQLLTLASEAQRRGIPVRQVVLYGPVTRITVRIEVENAGFRVFRNRNDLIAWIATN